MTYRPNLVSAGPPPSGVGNVGDHTVDSRGVVWWCTGPSGAWAPGSSLGLMAATPVAGFTLVNGTPNIISWTAPNDGQLHRATFFTTLHVTSGETGGAIGFTYTTPDGFAVASIQLIAGAQTNGAYTANPPRAVVCAPGSSVVVGQSSALTAGAAVVWAEIWGS